MTKREWLDGLKAGDEVIVGGLLKTVRRTTQTQVTIGADRYTRSFGHIIGGGGWGEPCTELSMPTPELIAESHRKAARGRAVNAWRTLREDWGGYLCSTAVNSLTVEELDALAVRLEEFRPDRPDASKR